MFSNVKVVDIFKKKSKYRSSCTGPTRFYVKQTLFFI